ncbi:MAG: tetratricopeptide repeat protein [bacterium]|nr:tetratricopeptide repeat protein [bacterium]
MPNIFQRITKPSLYLLVFLLPLFWLPFSFEAFELNKQYLLFFLVSLAFFSWLAKMVLSGELRFRKTPLDIFVGVFLLISVLSAVFSADKGSSIFGFYGRFSDGLIGLLSLGMMYFLITNEINKSVTAESIKKTFLWSVGLAVLATYFAISGIWGKLSFLPQVMRQKIFNPSAGSLEGLAVFLSVVVVFLTVKILFNEKKQLFSLEKLLLILSAALLLIIDYSASWLVLLVSLVAFLIFCLWKRLFKDRANNLLIPIALIVIAIFGLSVDLPSVKKGLFREQVLERGISWQVAFGAATDNVKSVFLGSGPGTFHYDFAKEKPASFNLNRFWQIRFDRSGSYLAEILGTTGFLGFISYLVLIGMFLLISYFLLQSVKISRQSSAVINGMPLLMTFVALIASQIFYYQNTVLAFTFWLFLGLGAASWEKGVSEKIFSFKKFPELNLVFNAILIMVALGLTAAFYFGARFYLADRNFAAAQTLTGGREKTAALEKAARLNPHVSQYWTMLAKSYFQEAQQELQKPADQGDKIYLQNRVALAIDAAKRAVREGPGQVAAFEGLATIYRDIRGFANGAQDWAVKYFQDAIRLEPTNPVLRTELAKIQEDPDQAKKELSQAIALKPDYLDALLQEAFMEEKAGNSAEAVSKMERLENLFPANVEVLFQLGRTYFNAGKTEEAISQLKKVLILVPDHSNSLYILGTIYQKKGDKAKAREYFERVLELNPDSLEVKKKLDEVK